MREVEVHIGMGLPGSGKTTYFETLAPEHGVYDPMTGMYKTRIDVDRMLFDKGFKRAVTNENGKLDVERLFDYCTSLGRRSGFIVIDGLFLEKAPVLDIIRQLSEMSVPQHFSRFQNDYKVVIDQWNEDRDQCLKNDLLRDRENKASFTIANAPYERFTLDELKTFVAKEAPNIVDISIVDHAVAVPEDWQLYTERPGRPDDARYMRSEYWSLGGTLCSYDNYERTISADDPKENDALDKFLEEHAPSITLLQYKKIVKECVTLETEEYSDYYGGHTREQYWRTDMKRLYEMLKEMNLLK